MNGESSDGGPGRVTLDAFLKQIGLERYLDAMRAADVDIDILPDLSEDDLREIGLSLGHRRRLTAGLAALREQGAGGGTTAGHGGAGPAVPADRGSERRQVTVMFCDLVGSTELSRHFDPEMIAALLRGYQDAVAGAISRFDGFVDRFLGDGTLAFFGFPRAREDAAERAARAGFAIVEAIRAMRDPSGAPLAVRVAIGSGLVFIDEGPETDGTHPPAPRLVGDVINMAARLQAVAPANGIVVSDATRRRLGALFEMEDFGRHALKGLGREVPVWRLLRERRAETRFEIIHSTGTGDIFGRDPEIALLRARWAAATEGELQFVLLAAEAGMGKSRLTRTLLTHIVHGPHLVLRYQCTPFHRGTALHPVIAQAMFAARIEATDSVPAKLDKLQTVMAEAGPVHDEDLALFADLLSIDHPVTEAAARLPADTRKRRVFDALIRQVIGLAKLRPVLMLVEDAHWIDPSFEELLKLAAETMLDRRVMILATTRPEGRGMFESVPNLTHLDLARLSRRDAREIVLQSAGADSLPEPLVEAIVEKADGNALFLEELTKAMIATVEATSGVGESLLGIPDTLQDSLIARLDRQLPESKAIAQVGAVLGREFSAPQIVALAGEAQEKLEVALRDLVRTDLLRIRMASGVQSFIFKHALIQDAAYNMLSRTRRRELHARCAQILMELQPEIRDLQPEILAHHYARAGEAERAITLWLKAGRRSAERSAISEAISHLEAGIALLEEIRDADRRQALELDLRVDLGVPLIARSGYASPACMANWARTRDLAEARRAPDARASGTYGLWAGRISLGETRTALDLANDVIALADHAEQHGLDIVGLRIRGLTHLTLGDLMAAADDLETAIARYVPERDAPLAFRFGQDPAIAAGAVLSVVRFMQGAEQAARDLGEDVVRRAEAGAHVNSICYAIAYGPALVARMDRDPAATRRYATLLENHADSQHLALWRAYADAFAGWADLQDGDPAEGLRRLEAALGAFAAAGAALFQPIHMAGYAEALWRNGDTAGARAAIGRAINEATRREEIWCAAELERVRGLCESERDAAG